MRPDPSGRREGINAPHAKDVFDIHDGFDMLDHNDDGDVFVGRGHF